MPRNAFELARIASLESGPRRDKLTLALADAIACRRMSRSKTADAIGDLLRNLVVAASRELRLTVAAKLADVDWAPRELVLSLALDEIDIAEPIISRCCALIEDDLVTIARQGAKAHRRALASRPDVTERVSDAIAASAEPEVLVALLENAAAKLSHGTLRLCVNTAREHEELHGPLAAREGLPPELAEAIYLIVSDDLRAQIAKHYDVDEAALRRIVDASAQQVATKQSDRAHIDAESAALVRALDESGALTAEFIATSAAEGRVEVFEHAVARLCGMDAAHVLGALKSDGVWAATLACRACDIPKRSFAGIHRALMQAGRLPPGVGSLVERTVTNTYVSQTPSSAAAALRRIVEAG